jgi:hypothetical protein
MNRMNLIELLAAVVVTAALSGCAGAPAPQHTPDVRPETTRDELGLTRNAWAKCVRAAIPRLDDPQSPSEVVARAAMKGCSGEYTDMVQALARTLAPTCGRDSNCTRGALAKAQLEATRAATDEVVSARIRVAGAQVLKCE